MITNKTITSELTELVRRIDEYVFILTNTTLNDVERDSILRQLRNDVQLAHSLLSRLEQSGTEVATESMAATLDSALMVLNTHRFFGAIAQVEINVL